MGYQYKEEEIRERTATALEMLLKNDFFLLEANVGERSIAHRLAGYLQGQFPDWCVDCEYNRDGIEPKELEGMTECDGHRSTGRVYPDIVVHQRGVKRNLLVIELKKEGLDPACDIEKLELFTSEKGRFHYSLGLFISFKNCLPYLKWFKNGKEIGEEHI